MSHKIAKAKRKFVHQMMPNISELPLSATEGTYTGRMRGISAEQVNLFKKKMGYFPIAQQFLTKECRKYWYKKA